VRRGNIVVYPRYQEQRKYPTTLITQNAIQAVRDAIDYLGNGDHVKPQLNHFAIAGHSAGGVVTANMAALARESGLPEPKAVMCVEPGNTWKKPEIISIPLADLSKISADTLLLAVSGEDDHLARDIDARRIFNESVNVAPENKNYIVVRTDTYGRVPLRADHFAPCSFNNKYDSGESLGLLDADQEFPAFERGPAAENALDYYAYWKLFDALTDAAFYRKNRQFALGNTQQQRNMGQWSDGRPVRELLVTEAER
jgi:hypothetical protein